MPVQVEKIAAIRHGKLTSKSLNLKDFPKINLHLNNTSK